MKFRSNNGPVRVASISGHIAIVDKEWRELPEVLHREALARGCECDQGRFRAEEGRIESSDAAKTAITSHDEAIRTALTTMLSRKEDGDFNGDGLPNTNVVSKLAGLAVKKVDALRVFRAMQAEAGAGDGAGDGDGNDGQGE